MLIVGYIVGSVVTESNGCTVVDTKVKTKIVYVNQSVPVDCFEEVANDLVQAKHNENVLKELVE